MNSLILNKYKEMGKTKPNSKFVPISYPYLIREWLRLKKNKKYLNNHKLQIELFDNDFNECDSGYCGL